MSRIAAIEVLRALKRATQFSALTESEYGRQGVT